MMHLLDSNTFIEAKNRYYHLDICPGYWEWILHRFQQNDVASIKPVFDELISGKDDLAEWTKVNKHIFHDVSDIATQSQFVAVSDVVVNMQNVHTGAAAQFLSGADPWLIARAMQIGAAVVTHETYNPAIKKRVTIPNVCAVIGLEYMNTFDLLLKLKAEFVMA